MDNCEEKKDTESSSHLFLNDKTAFPIIPNVLCLCYQTKTIGVGNKWINRGVGNDHSP